MAKTKHMHQRMCQRGIDEQLVRLVQQFGISRDSSGALKTILSLKGIDKSLAQLDKLRKNLLRARDKGGVVLVESTDRAQITTYRYTGR